MMAMDLKALAKAGMQNDIAEIVELNVPVRSKKGDKRPPGWTTGTLPDLRPSDAGSVKLAPLRSRLS